VNAIGVTPAAAPAAPAPAAPSAPAAAAASVPAPAAAPATGGRAAAALARMQPTDEQFGIILEACGAAIDSHCAGAERGPGWQLQCLRENAANLSTGCEQVLVAVASTAPAASPPPAQAATAPPPAVIERPARPVSPRKVLFLIRTACAPDFRGYCGGAGFGGGRAIGCLREHAHNLSPTCRKALASIAGRR
jgi:hypothetical protein